MRYLILIITVLCFGDDKPKNAPPNTVQLTDKLGSSMILAVRFIFAPKQVYVI